MAERQHIEISDGSYGSISIDVEGEVATFYVHNIGSRDILEEAFDRARAAGAQRGTMITSGVLDETIQKRLLTAVAKNRDYFGGHVTRLHPDSSLGPRFRIEWDQFP